MNRTLLIIFLVCSPLFLLKSTAQIFEWGASISGTSGNDYPHRSVLDSNGNVLLVGRFTGTVDFDPGAASYDQTATGGLNGYLLKLSSEGEFMWVKVFSPVVSGQFNFTSLTLDYESNIYIGGNFYGEVDFDPGESEHITGVSDNHLFTCKLNSSGDFLWVHTSRAPFGNVTNYHLEYSAIDNSVYGSVMYSDTIEFNTIDGLIVFGHSALQASYNTCFYKLDLLGNCLWAKRVEGNSSYMGDYKSLAIDSQGNLICALIFEETIDVDPGPGIIEYTVEEKGLAVLKLNSLGELIWSRKFESEYLWWMHSVETDQNDNVYIASSFLEELIFEVEDGDVSLISAGDKDICLLKLNTESELLWVKRLGGIGDDLIVSVDIDDQNDVHVVGEYQYSFDVNPGPGIYTISGGGSNSSIFYAELSDEAELIRGKKMFYGELSTPLGFDISEEDEILIAGSFSGTADLNPWYGVFEVQAEGSYDGFVQKFGVCSIEDISFATTVDTTVCTGFYSPTSDYWTESGFYEDVLINSMGCDSIRTYNLTVLEETTSELFISSCQAYTSPSGSYTWAQSGVYTDILTNSQGCDSIVTVHLEILNTYSTFLDESCDFYELPSGLMVFESGTYFDTIPNYIGCDSIVTFHLTIHHLLPEIVVGTVSMICTISGADYQWLDCDSSFEEITPGSGQSYFPDFSGNFAIEVSEFGCTDTSDCYSFVVGIEENTNLNQPQFIFFPETGAFRISSSANLGNSEIKLFDASGQMVSQNFYDASNEIICDIPRRPGFYVVFFMSDKYGLITYKMVIN